MVLKKYNSDCVAGMKKLESLTVDACVTSPPYNIGIKYSKFDDSEGRDDYLAWSARWLKQIHRLLKLNGSLFLNVGSSPRSPMLPFELVLQACNSGFKLQNTFHWVKSVTIGARTYGHFKPINSSRFVNDIHEYIFHLTCYGDVTLDRKAIGVPYTDESNIARWSGDSVHCRGNVWHVPYKTRVFTLKHPATFPSELAEMCLKLHGNLSHQIVLDPFMGTGTTAKAACKLGCFGFIGYEIDPEYFRLT